MQFEVAFPKKQARQYNVRFKEALPSIIDIVEDKLFNDRLFLYPERRYVQRPEGGIMRMWEENSSGDDWWDLQVRVYLFICFVLALTLRNRLPWEITL